MSRRRRLKEWGTRNFKKFPYPGWITVFMLSLAACVATYHYQKAQCSPEYLSANLQAYVNNINDQIQEDYKNGLFEHPNLLPGTAQGGGRGYLLFLVENGSNTYWNTTETELGNDLTAHPESVREGQLEKLNNGYFYAQSRETNQGQYAVTLIPISYRYPVNNRYFQSYFPADRRIPETTVPDKKTGQTAINIQGKTAFFISIYENAENIYKVGAEVWVLTALLLLSALFWIHETVYWLSVIKGKPLWAMVIISIVAAGFHFLKSTVGFPAGFVNTDIYSPELFSMVNGGNMVTALVGTLLYTWVSYFCLLYIPFKQIRFGKSIVVDKVVRLALVLVVTWLVFKFNLAIVPSMVLDSKISFETGNFSSISPYTFAGIFILIFVAINSMSGVGIMNILLGQVFNRKYLRYLTLILSGSIFACFLDGNATVLFKISVIAMCIVFMFIIDYFGLPFTGSFKRNRISRPFTLYMWFALVTLRVTVEISYFNYTKERDIRISYARKQELKKDGLVDYNLSETADKLAKDKSVVNYLANPDERKLPALKRYIAIKYLSEYDPKYTIDVVLHAKGHAPTEAPAAAIRQPGTQPEDTAATGILYHVRRQVSKQGNETAGTIELSVSIDKRPASKNRHTFLELRTNPTDQQYYDKYSFALYRDDKLVTQGGNEYYPFAYTGTKSNKEYVFRNNGRHSSSLTYRPNRREVVIVDYARNLLTNFISLFSYVLIVLLMASGAIFLSRKILFYPLHIPVFFHGSKLTILDKVNMTILLTVFVALATVGATTISILNNRYKEGQRANLQNMLFFYSKNILPLLADYTKAGPHLRNNEVADAALSYQLKSLAATEGADINLYDNNAKLLASSQADLYSKGLLTQNMNPKALAVLFSNKSTELTIPENLGNLAYQSTYAPLLNEADTIIGYINIPYYVASTEIKNETDSVLATLVNIYSLAFFVSGICAILISNNIIRSFRLLTNQFRSIRLHHNNTIYWPHNDEIGILVKEYNLMIEKVETMASKLARTEREAAWRDIARQVAHEIKNPLTPMKLNIQYLQQAIKSGREGIEQLTLKVSDGLIEQIENLNLIATEFSNYAKLPEAKPESINLSKGLLSLTELFQKENSTRITLAEGPNVYINIDKSHFIRIFTNLIKNALQALDGMANGQVALSYEQKGTNIVVKVHDNGPGIAEDLQAKLFRPYFTTKSSGTGLGLPMTRNMVENADGEIWFESGEARGTAFYVQLPIAPLPTQGA
ncbi:MAG: HAMP domain-containing sensor histidine kinase [Edaphocola sp.]